MNRILQLRVVRIILITGMLAVCLVLSAAAQGRVRGVVRDESGNPIPGATVTAENILSNASHSFTTNDSGLFSFIVLRRGSWRFIVTADGFRTSEAFARVRTVGRPTRLRFTMEVDLFNPQTPTTGVLAGLKATDLVKSLEEAEGFYDQGQYDAAIDAYRLLLERVPALTSLGLQIGHAFREKQDPAQALAAYRTVLDGDPSNVEALAAIETISQPIQ